MVNDSEPRYQLVDTNGNVVGSLFATSGGELVLQEGTSGSNNELTLATDGTVTLSDVTATDSITDASGTQHTGELADLSDTEADTRVDVSDSGSLILSEPTDINFTESGAASVSVTDDGDGSVSVDVSATDTDTDTRTDVSESGTTIVSETTDINFTASSAASVTVSDDADGSVTVDISATDTDTQTDVSEGGNLIVSNTGDINFDSGLSVTDDTDGTVTVDATASTQEIELKQYASQSDLPDPSGLSKPQIAYVDGLDDYVGVFQS